MASGNSLASFDATDNHPPATGYATLDTRNSHPVLDFDAAAVEAAVFSGVLARHYSSGGITARLGWMTTSAITGDVVWNAAFERHDDEGTDLDADSFASAQAATATAPGTTGMVQYTDIVFTNGGQIDSVAIGEHFRLKVSRDATNGSDTMTGDAELLSVELRET